MNLKELGRQVFERRQRLGLSQAALGQKLRIPRSYVALIERGKVRDVPLHVLDRLAIVFGVPPAILVGQIDIYDTVIPTTLREFGLAEGLSFKVVETLAQISRQDQEPQSAEEWRRLYDAFTLILKKTG